MASICGSPAAWLQLFAAIPGTTEYEMIRAYLSLVVCYRTVLVLLVS